MAIDNTPPQDESNKLQAIPFGNIIGGPLKACIDAQTAAAKTTWEFMQNVGLNTDSQTGDKKEVNVSFKYIRDGQPAQLNVPLLTIVPIPYIGIGDIDIDFKAKTSPLSTSLKIENKGTPSETDATLKSKQDSIPADLARILKLLDSNSDK